ncbi:hypothetical protein [Pseudorhizobium pelagicum]|uniref:Uncharacterized protein n=1 Tax=Pseudorhizobium pelagicum TaxID=1509405 RepID=A0A922P086_9HYPH|nr:hypothetical protein [Pseudorhizobium pelagicum]KEQ07022.1 hypothetical protein GV67_22565 [Pseudorhizobium pelagicum]KEQ09967.1 hypothetical protein GV68_18355 [Pseudorhizobium pelagicum]
MPEDIAKALKAAIRHRISCLDRPTLNGFAGTGRLRRRETQLSHTIARRIVYEALPPFSFRWDFGNFEPAGRADIYLTVFTALFDIGDEDARRWTDKAEWDAARDEAARDIVRALMRKFVVTKRRIVSEPAGANGPVGGAHSISHSRYEDEI